MHNEAEQLKKFKACQSAYDSMQPPEYWAEDSGEDDEDQDEEGEPQE
jgi:hypothetical protein